MEFFIILFITVVVLDIVSLRWGFDSTDAINSPEWERRKLWNAAYSADTVRIQPVRNIHLN